MVNASRIGVSPESVRRLPLYQRLREEFVRCISDQTWLPSVALPAESELARTFGVAVGTVRKAMDQLVAEGLLLRHQGRGTFVRRPTFNASLFRFFRFKAQDSDYSPPKGVILRRTAEKAPTAVARRLGLRPASRVIRLDRLRILEDRPLLREEIWLPRSRFAALLDLPLDQFGDLLYPLYEARCDQVVTSAEETLSVGTANAQDAAAIGVAEGQPVVLIDRLAFDLARTPIEWRQTRGRADDFRYRVEIR